MFAFAHVSDLHIDGGHRNTERAERVMTYVNTLPHPVDAVVVTGDIADHGLPIEYAQARNLLSIAPPVFVCPGNHDSRPDFRTSLLGVPGNDTPINQDHTVSGVRFLLCDSTIPHRDNGILTDETIAWLEQKLPESADTPTFLCLHHPPVVLHAPLLDRIRLEDEQRLEDIIERHSQVVAVLCGHAHAPAATTFAGQPLLVAPGVASTLRLPWERDEAELDYQLPPAVALHVLDDQRRLTTHYRLVV